MSILERLTEGMVERSMKREGAAILQKWEKTGLLEGLRDERQRNGMALMLEQQARELLREASTMEAGNVEGFAAVAFPIVRRVFGGLIANDIVSVQPMSMPTGLIFFLDFVVDRARLNYANGDSLYGGGVVGQQLTGGVQLTGDSIEKGFYFLGQGYSSPTGSATITITQRASGTVGGTWGGTAAYANLGDRLVEYDPDLSGSLVCITTAPKANFTNLNPETLRAINLTNLVSGRQARRWTREDPITSTNYMFVAEATGSMTLNDLTASAAAVTAASFCIVDSWTAGGALGSVRGTTPWDLENENNIPEIQIRVNSISITAITKKLKTSWSPELGQDLMAYQNLDAEVELTGIMSEQVALELDREIIGDLIQDATAGQYYWSRQPGNFVNRETGASTAGAVWPDFTGTISEWYESLLEVINDLSAVIHRKTLMGGANFMVVGPEMAALLEMTNGFRGSVTVDDDRGDAGAVKVGAINKKWDVYVDPYFYRNLILLGRRGKSFLESGYVYSPYVPVVMSPTIPHPESFVPRKMLMTRYGKAMVRPDMYGKVVVLNMLG